MADTIMIDRHAAGRIAFDGYRESVEGVTYDGKPIPLWHELTDAVREAWCCAASAAIVYQRMQEVLRRG